MSHPARRSAALTRRRTYDTRLSWPWFISRRVRRYSTHDARSNATQLNRGPGAGELVAFSQCEYQPAERRREHARQPSLRPRPNGVISHSRPQYRQRHQIHTRPDLGAIVNGWRSPSRSGCSIGLPLGRSGAFRGRDFPGVPTPLLGTGCGSDSSAGLQGRRHRWTTSGDGRAEREGPKSCTCRRRAGDMLPSPLQPGCTLLAVRETQSVAELRLS